MTRLHPKRLHRTRQQRNATPSGAIYVGRPTLWSNPFQRAGIGHARSVILYRAWIAGELGAKLLGTLRYGEHEIASLGRWRRNLVRSLPHLAGRDLQCWCPLTSAWCHADVLLAIANAERRLAA